jgi:acetate CoA/acetoacetate CoA-transferase alpha subunit
MGRNAGPGLSGQVTRVQEVSLISKPVITAAEAAGKVKEGDTIMVGGFMACGSPATILKALEAAGTRDLTLICNDTGVHDPASGLSTGVAPLVLARQFRRIIASHIGANPETQRQMREHETDVVLVPQGTLAEQVRAQGAGLGGVLTPTGIGTAVAKGKQIILVDHIPYLLERPLKADVAFVKARKADRAGNLVYHGTARNFNPLMATAAEVVIAEVEEIVDVGALDPDTIHTPSIHVDFIVDAGRIER